MTVPTRNPMLRIEPAEPHATPSAEGGEPMQVDKPSGAHAALGSTRTAPARRWRVRRSYFPLSLPGESLGEVEAPSRAEAEQLAVAQFGGPIAVEPVTLRDVLPLERAVRRVEREAARRPRSGRTLRDLFGTDPSGPDESA